MELMNQSQKAKEKRTEFELSRSILMNLLQYLALHTLVHHPVGVSIDSFTYLSTQMRKKTSMLTASPEMVASRLSQQVMFLASIVMHLEAKHLFPFLRRIISTSRLERQFVILIDMRLLSW